MLQVRAEGCSFVLKAEGHLDGEAGEVLERAAEAARAQHEGSLTIDLTDLSSATEDGAVAAARCTRLGVVLIGNA